MEFSTEELNEFKTEAEDLLDQAENALLALDEDPSLSLGLHYDAIFRAFHSIKGAAGMMEMTLLQSHMHQLEHLLTGFKNDKILAKNAIDLFLRGADAARTLMEGGQIEFSYSLSSQSTGAKEAADEVAAQESQFLSKTNLQQLTPRRSLGRAIVIDDEKDIVEYLVDILESASFEVKGFTDAKEALSQVEIFDPDVVFTDLAMPEMNGMQILEALHKRDNDLPVVFISGHVTKEVLLKSILYGISNVIEKPFSENVVVQTCANACQKHQLTKLLNKSINLLLYQFSDIDSYLASQGKEEIRSILHKEMETLLANRQKLKVQNRKIKAS